MAAAAASAALPLALPAMLDFYRQCAVGLSGVIFGLVLIDSHQAASPTRRQAGGRGQAGRGLRGCRGHGQMVTVGPACLHRSGRGQGTSGVAQAAGLARRLGVCCAQAPGALCLLPPCSIFGLFSVPTWAFPWALLVIWQLLVPRASLLGHLTGLLVR